MSENTNIDKIEIDVESLGVDNGNYFGFPFTPEQSRLVLLSAPWDATASYGGGACFAPDGIIEASTQLDFYEPLYPQGWREGIGTIPIEYHYQEASILIREEALRVMRHLNRGGKTDDDNITKRIDRVNRSTNRFKKYIYKTSSEWLAKDKIVGLVGGDHSVAYGLIKALSQREKAISILQIDAHADLRQAYQGFTDSHASIMYNVLTTIGNVDKLVQVGLRDFGDCEVEVAKNDPRVVQYTDFEMASKRFEGVKWQTQCQKIISELGHTVYISFDIDGLSPDNSPSTGTPVPGGLSFNQAIYLINEIAESGRRIVGFDLCEVVPSQKIGWDSNVGARVLYKLCNLTLKSQNRK